MGRLVISSDLHLGHNGISNYRPMFSSDEEHNEVIFDNIATNVNRTDSLILTGDVAFDVYWATRLSNISCAKKTLLLGNHDTEHLDVFHQLVQTFDVVHSLWTKRNVYFSHFPIHPNQFRGRIANIHGHLHDKVVTTTEKETFQDPIGDYTIDVEVVDPRYINACVDQWEFKPITFAALQDRFECLQLN